MKDLVKQYWPISILAIVLLVITTLLIAETIEGRFETRNVDGQDIVFEFNGVNVSADDLYDQLFDTYGFEAIIRFLELHVYRHAFEPSEELVSESRAEIDQLIINFRAHFGEGYEQQIYRFVQSIGLPPTIESLYEHALIIRMIPLAQRMYIDEQMDNYFPAYFEARQPRVISHILVRMEDPYNPTEEEQARLEEVMLALDAPDADFASIAYEFSDDTLSALQGGSLGFVDLDTINNFVIPFRNQVHAVGVGETTEWFTTEFGFHIIRVDSESLEDFMEFDAFYTRLFAFYPNLRNTITWHFIQAQNISFANNPELEQRIRAHYGADVENDIDPEYDIDTENGVDNGNGG